MTRRGNQARLALGAVMLAGAASAAEPAASAARPDAPAEAASPAGAAQATLESKQRLVKLLLAQSPAVQRIPQSGNAQAKSKLAAAQALFAQAGAEADAGRADSAIKMLDQALLEIVSAARLVPDPAQMAAQERTRYGALREGIRSFLGLHKKLSARMAAANPQARAAPLDAERINGMMGKAETLAAAGNYQEANALLNNAYQSVVAALNKMLMAETIVYDLKFDSPQEEFQHELARNRSYEELIPLALAQMNAAHDSALLSERHVQQSRELRELAQKQAAQGDYQTALKTIQDATGHLQRSLRVAGIVVPQSPEK